MRKSPPCPGWTGLLLLAAAAHGVHAADNLCDQPAEHPDLIAGDIPEVRRHGTAGGVTGYSIATLACNEGTCWAEWDRNTDKHPVIGQNMFRLKDGRFEQIGQSWLKHGFNALAGTFCSPDCIAGDGAHLGVNCSDTYTSATNGQQANLGPKFEVNPSTGSHPHPVTGAGLTGNVIYKRLQVHNADLDPALNAGALYFVEAQYVTEDDATAGYQHDNASYRPITVSGTSPVFPIAVADETVPGQPAIAAWAAETAGVQLVEAAVPGDGRFLVAARAVDLGDGTWRYEYAVQNFNSHRAAGSFAVPVHPGTSVTHVGFHDVDYHSGEPFDLTDWTDDGAAVGELRWTTLDYAVNADANALRWGTLYNFRFDADAPPEPSRVTLGLFRPGSPGEIVVSILGPRTCNADAACDTGESACNCASDCGDPPGAEIACADALDDDCDGAADCADLDCCGAPVCPQDDGDGDGVAACADCADADGGVWAPPGEVSGLLLNRDPDGTLLGWTSPVDPGAASVLYEVLRSENAASFVEGTICLGGADPAATSWTDAGPEPEPGVLFAYLVRATNGCPGGTGSLGAGSDGLPRAGASCP